MELLAAISSDDDDDENDEKSLPLSTYLLQFRRPSERTIHDLRFLSFFFSPIDLPKVGIIH